MNDSYLLTPTYFLRILLSSSSSCASTSFLLAPSACSISLSFTSRSSAKVDESCFSFWNSSWHRPSSSFLNDTKSCCCLPSVPLLSPARFCTVCNDRDRVWQNLAYVSEKPGSSTAWNVKFGIRIFRGIWLMGFSPFQILVRSLQSTFPQSWCPSSWLARPRGQTFGV